MTQEELETKYAKIPNEMRKARRWVGFRIEEREGKKTKVPYNAMTGKYGSSVDPNTWTSFYVAISGCVKYQFDGIGFCLGDNPEDGTYYSGVDLDNHGEEDFSSLASDFIDTLNSYTEYSPSGKGIHIICRGKKPQGRCRKSNIEMYGSGRFFTMTGNAIKSVPVRDAESELLSLWEKYLKEEARPEQEAARINRDSSSDEIVFGENIKPTTIEIGGNKLDDDDVIDIGCNNNPNFERLYCGDTSMYQDDHSRADAAFCQMLAFWTACDKDQMDRIFRKSGLMREKWDKNRGDKTYGEMTIDNAISKQVDVYTPKPKKVVFEPKIKQEMDIISEPKKKEEIEVIVSPSEMVEFDDRNDPIIKDIPLSFKYYPLNDTGNAERFYDYFGGFFKYNEDDKRFMFWNGKQWSRNTPSAVRKYVNKLIDILNDEVKNTERKITKAAKQENPEQSVDELKALLKAQIDNVKKVSNTTGKNSLITELQALHDLPVKNYMFDSQEEYLNTDSGVVNLYTGEVYPFDRKYMLSKNTHVGVSFNEPTVWLKFLHDILRRDNEEETQELIETLQMALGEALTGRTNKEHFFILYGSGSNGKSTFIKVVNDCFGEYGTTMSTELLVNSGVSSSAQSQEFSFDSLAGSRIVTTSETNEGAKLDESFFKKMLSGEKIKGQKKYGDSYSFLPTFTPMMSTNNKPIIRATDDGTWRRIYFIPFLNKFKGKNKDVSMPKKLTAELPQILGWMIQGSVRLHKEFKDDLPTPRCLENALANYKKELDVIVAFLNDMTTPLEDAQVNTQDLYREYKEWCKQNGEYQYNERKFKLEMPKKGYPVKRDRNNGEVYSGLKLIKDKATDLIFGEEI